MALFPAAVACCPALRPGRRIQRPRRACAAQALFGTLTWDVVVLTMLYSTAGLGIAIVNDFKSIEGDRRGPARRASPRGRRAPLGPWPVSPRWVGRCQTVPRTCRLCMRAKRCNLYPVHHALLDWLAVTRLLQRRVSK